MGTRLVPHAAALFVALLAVISFGVAAWKAEAAAAPVVVGSIKCLDCSPSGVNAEDAFKGLQVAIKCKSGADERYETKALGPLDDTGVFSIPLAAELLRDDGEMDRDCFAQLHTAPDTPCVGQAPPRIAPATGPNQDGNTTSTTTYLAAAADTAFSPVACACGKFKKKHFMFGPPPPPPRPEAPKPPTPTYGPPMPTPAPEPKPPAPPAEEPEPFFHKHPKMKKFMHKKKPCPPLADDDTTRPAAAGQEKLPKKLN